MFYGVDRAELGDEVTWERDLGGLLEESSVEGEAWRRRPQLA